MRRLATSSGKVKDSEAIPAAMPKASCIAVRWFSFVEFSRGVIFFTPSVVVVLFFLLFAFPLLRVSFASSDTVSNCYTRNNKQRRWASFAPWLVIFLYKTRQPFLFVQHPNTKDILILLRPASDDQSCADDVHQVTNSHCIPQAKRRIKTRKPHPPRYFP